MNLRLLANTNTQNINPNISATWKHSSGYTNNADYTRTPTYTTTTVKVQVQAMTAEDLKHIQELNIEGVVRSVYIYGNLQGIVRADKMGGDILDFVEVPSGPTQSWKVVKVVETWPDWAHVIVCMLNPSTI
jgi:hypothetical protein